MFARGLAAAALSLLMIGFGVAADLQLEKAPIVAPPLAKPPGFFLFSDTQISYRYVFPAAEPGVSVQKADGSFETRGIPKHVLNISHADAWEYGTNFFSLDILKSGVQDPAGTINGPNGFQLFGYGATEAYGLYRGTLSLNKILNTDAFKVPGIVKEISLSFGFDANAKDTAFGPKKRDVVGGLSFAFDVPTGFLNLRIHAYKEWNRNGFAAPGYRYVEFETVPEFEIVYNYPLAWTGLPLSLAGFNNIVLPKGHLTNFPGDTNKAGLEFLSRTNLVLDIGKLIWDQPNKIDAFVGFQYWRNKFGTQETATFKGTEEKAFLAGIAIHVF